MYDVYLQQQTDILVIVYAYILLLHFMRMNAPGSEAVAMAPSDVGVVSSDTFLSVDGMPPVQDHVHIKL